MIQTSPSPGGSRILCNGEQHSHQEGRQWCYRSAVCSLVISLPSVCPSSVRPGTMGNGRKTPHQPVFPSDQSLRGCALNYIVAQFIPSFLYSEKKLINQLLCTRQGGGEYERGHDPVLEKPSLVGKTDMCGQILTRPGASAATVKKTNKQQQQKPVRWEYRREVLMHVSTGGTNLGNTGRIHVKL